MRERINRIVKSFFDWLKKVKRIKVYALLGIAVVVFCPFLIALGTSADILNWATNDNDWIGFWGDYFGTILGNLITLLVLWWTITDNRRTRDREERIAYYNKLIELQATFVTDIANYYSAVQTLFTNPTNENSKECLEKANLVARESAEISILLQTRREPATDMMLEELIKINTKNNTVTKHYSQCIKPNSENQEVRELLIGIMKEYEETSPRYLGNFAVYVKQGLKEE